MRNGQDVGVVGGSRVSAGAFEQNQVFAARLTRGANGVVQFSDAGHAGGDDHRLASGGHAVDQVQVSACDHNADTIDRGKAVEDGRLGAFISRSDEVVKCSHMSLSLPYSQCW